MAPTTRFVYTETTRPPWWVLALLWGACLLPLLGVSGVALVIVSENGFFALASPLGYALSAGAGLCILTPILFHLLFGKLVVGVSESEARVVVEFGVGWLHKLIPLDQIEAVTTTHYRPIMDFGGWGIRWSGMKQAWTIRGNQAVVLELRGRGTLYLGSETPTRLREAIEVAIASHSTRGAR
jgi:hypothetical protein